jgi:thiamine transporter
MADTKTRILVEIALTVALAAVLNLVKLWRMPYGGDVSLEMLPIVVLALRRGWRSGALVGVAGVFASPLRKAREADRSAFMWIVAGVTTGAAARFASHYISGLVFFGQYAPDGQPTWLYSLLYNGFYMLPATILCAVAAALILPALERAVPTR